MIGRHQAAWKNPKIVTALSLVFLCGALSGAVIYKLASQKVSAKQAAASWKDSTKEQTLAHLRKELDLTPDQAGKIETVLDDFAMYYQMLSQQMEEVMTQSKQQIDTVLNEEQRKKFGRIMNELKERKSR